MVKRMDYHNGAGDPTFTAPRKMTLDGTTHRAGRALQVGTAGAATLTFDDGTVATLFPLKEGLNAIGGVVSISATGLVAADIWILD